MVITFQPQYGLEINIFADFGADSVSTELRGGNQRGASAGERIAYQITGQGVIADDCLHKLQRFLTWIRFAGNGVNIAASFGPDHIMPRARAGSLGRQPDLPSGDENIL